MRHHRKIAIVFCVALFLSVAIKPTTSNTQVRVTNAPANLIAWYSGNYTQINWDDEPAAPPLRYNVYRAVGSPENWEKLNESPFALTSFVDYSAPQFELVYYKVAVVSEAGDEGQDSSPLAVHTTPPPEKPLAELQALAQAYNKNNIITDQQLISSSAMSLSQIQSFLSSQGSVLANYSTGGKTAAQHISDACQTHGINPQVVLVTLQKEKGLIKSGTANPNNFAMGWNTGDASSSGFADQIYWGTRQFKRYYDNLGGYSDVNGASWAVGQTRTVSDGTVTGANTATPGLYIYTPWIGQGGGGQTGIGGNYLFWDLWYNTFGFSAGGGGTSSSSDGFDFPVGKPDGIGWLNNHNGLGFLEQHNYGGSCGLTYHPGNDFNKDGTSGDGDRYEPVYAVANGVVVGSAYYGTSTWGNVIVIEHTLSDGSKVWSQYGHLEDRWVQQIGATVSKGQQIGRVGKGDGSLAAHLHFEIRKVQMAPNEFPCGQSQSYVQSRYHDPIAFINSHRSSTTSCGNGSSASYRVNGGPPIHPNGTLIKVSGNDTVYLIQNGQKRGITSGSVLQNLYQQSNSNFSNSVITVASDELSKYPTGLVVSGALSSNGRGQPDGRLIRPSSGSEVSIVTNNGRRRPFALESAFLGLGYLQCNAVTVSDYGSYPEDPIADGTSPLPTLTSSLTLTPSGPYTVGQTVTARFSITNRGNASITFSILTAGGRLNDTLVRDFPAQTNITLGQNQSWNYQRDYTFSEAGSYKFFPAFRTPDDIWKIALQNEIGADPNVVTVVNVSVGAASQPPPPPSTNAATNVTSNSATLSWSAVSGTTQYRVQVSTSSVFDTSADGRDCFNCIANGNQLLDAPTTSYNLSGLTAGTNYFWRVRAGRFNTVSEWTTDWSTVSGFTTTQASSSWSSLGGWADRLVVAQNADGRQEVFARGGDNALWHKSQISGGSNNWTGWSWLGGWIHELAVGRNTDGRLEVFARGGDNALWHMSQIGAGSNTWTGWSWLGGNVSNLVVVNNSDGRLEVFARGGNGALWHTSQDFAGSGTWAGWSSLGGGVNNLAAARNADGRLEVFAQGGNNAVWRISQSFANSSSWGTWSSLGGAVNSLIVGSNADGRLEIFVRGGDGALWHTSQDFAGSGTWAGWSSLGGGVNNLAAARNADGRLEVFAQGGNNAVWRISQSSANSHIWTGWSSLGGSISKIAVGGNVGGGGLGIYALGNDNAVWHR